MNKLFRMGLLILIERVQLIMNKLFRMGSLILIERVLLRASHLWVSVYQL